MQKTYDLCKTKGYALPTVYQGNCDPGERRFEADLFPSLRKLGLNFYAYSLLRGRHASNCVQILA